MRLATLLAAGTIAITCTAGTAQTVTTTEKKVTSSDGTVTKTETTVSSYVDRTTAVYKAVGIPEEKIIRLKDFDTKIYQARVAGDTVKVKEYYSEQTKFLTPAEVEKVRVYFREHPVTTGKIVTTWEETPVVVEKRTEVNPIGVKVGPVEAGVTVQKTETVPATTVKTETIHESTN